MGKTGYHTTDSADINTAARPQSEMPHLLFKAVLFLLCLFGFEPRCVLNALIQLGSHASVVIRFFTTERNTADAQVTMV